MKMLISIINAIDVDGQIKKAFANLVSKVIDGFSKSLHKLVKLLANRFKNWLRGLVKGVTLVT